jgi:hypothetical protein
MLHKPFIHAPKTAASVPARAWTVHARIFHQTVPKRGRFHSIFTGRALYDVHIPAGRFPMNETSVGPMKILLAEDDNDMRRFLVKALQNAGYRRLISTMACRPITGCARSRSSCC